MRIRSTAGLANGAEEAMISNNSSSLHQKEILYMDRKISGEVYPSSFIRLIFMMEAAVAVRHSAIKMQIKPRSTAGRLNFMMINAGIIANRTSQIRETPFTRSVGFSGCVTMILTAISIRNYPTDHCRSAVSISDVFPHSSRGLACGKVIYQGSDERHYFNGD